MKEQEKQKAVEGVLRGVGSKLSGICERLKGICLELRCIEKSVKPVAPVLDGINGFRYVEFLMEMTESRGFLSSVESDLREYVTALGGRHE